MRSVRYSLKQRRIHQSFHFAFGGDAKWRRGCKILGEMLLIHDNAVAERVGKELVLHYPDDHVRARFGPRWTHRLAPWVFACYDNPDVCRNFTATLSPEMPWRRRLVAVGQFMDVLRHTGLSTPVRSDVTKVFVNSTPVVVADTDPAISPATGTVPTTQKD